MQILNFRNVSKNAFSLMELIVVILLLGILFSLVIGSLSRYEKETKNKSIKDITTYMQKANLQNDSVFYIYGEKCEHYAIESDSLSYQDDLNFTFSSNYETFAPDKYGDLKKVEFKDIALDQKIESVCFKMHFDRSRFVDKIILKAKQKYLLFLPFFQEIKTYNSFKKASKAYFLKEFLPKRIDDYHTNQ